MRKLTMLFIFGTLIAQLRCGEQSVVAFETADALYVDKVITEDEAASVVVGSIPIGSGIAASVAPGDRLVGVESRDKWYPVRRLAELKEIVDSLQADDRLSLTVLLADRITTMTYTRSVRGVGWKMKEDELESARTKPVSHK